MAEMSRFIVFSETSNIDARLGIFTGTFTGSFFCCIVNFTLSFSKLRYFYRIIYWDILVFCFVSYTCSQLHFIVERCEFDSIRSLYQEFL